MKRRDKGYAKTLYIPAEELSTYCSHLNEILEGRERHPNQINKRRFTVNTNDIIIMESTSSNSELVIKHIIPDDIKKLSHELAAGRKALGSYFF